jgi:hypothetical protein
LSVLCPDCDVGVHLTAGQREAVEVTREGRAPLLLDDYTLQIRDLASKRGTFVNGRVGAGDTILLQVDMVSIGEMTFLIDFNQSPRDETAVRTAALACDRNNGHL